MTKTERHLLLAAILFLLLLFLLARAPGDRDGDVSPAFFCREDEASSQEPLYLLVDTRIDLNSATEEELCSLPGIGEVLAHRIVEYRARHGPFASPEELLAVEGVGERVVDRLRLAPPQASGEEELSPKPPS